MATNHVRNGRHDVFKETSAAIARFQARLIKRGGNNEQQLKAAEKVCGIYPDAALRPQAEGQAQRAANRRASI